MKTPHPPLASAFAALLPTLLMASPALAQETQTTAPPVVQAAPPVAVPDASPPLATQTVTPPPVVATVSDPRAAPVPENAAPAPRNAPKATQKARSVPRSVAPRPVAARVPVAAAPIREPAPAPAAAPTVPAATAPVAAPAAADAAPAATRTATITTTSQQGALWPWIVGALIVLGGILAFAFSRRRRDVAVYDEPVYEEPVYQQPVAEPAFAAPLAVAPVIEREPQFLDRTPVAPVAAPVAVAEPTPAEHSEIVAADEAEVEALTAGTPTATGRPWLEFAMRPVRAGASIDEAMVEVELTVGNAGSVDARDVRIATFMFASEPTDQAAFERLLIERGEQGMSDAVSIAAGEGTRLDATLAVPRDSVSDLFNPVVVADARYRLPDGSEGRTLASFTIGRTDAEGDFGPLANERGMHDDIEARLYAMPERV